MDKPVFKYAFICGAKRSGTTILTALLDNHPQLFVFPGEFQVYHKDALGRFRRDRKYDIRYMLSAISPYIQEVNAQKKEAFRARVDILQVRKELLSLESKLTRNEFLNLFSYYCMRSAGTSPKQVKYVVIKTMYNGIDFADETVFRNFKIVTVRESNKLIVSYRAKFLKSNMFKYKLLGNFFLQNYFKAHVQKTLKHIAVVAGNTVLVRLEELQSDPERVMENMAQALGIEYNERLTIPSFAGRGFSGHFYDVKKNVGKISKEGSSYEGLLPLEKWGLDVLNENIQLKDPFKFRFAIGLPFQFVYRYFLQFIVYGTGNFRLCAVDLVEKNWGSIKSGRYGVALKLPLRVAEMVYRHLRFFPLILSVKLNILIRNKWGIYYGNNDADRI